MVTVAQALKPLEFDDGVADSPTFQLSLMNHLRAIDQLNGGIQIVVNAAKETVEAGKVLSSSVSTLATAIANFKLTPIDGFEPTPEDSLIDESFLEFASILEELEEQRQMFLTQTVQLLVDPLDRFCKNDLSTIKETQRTINKSSKNYYELLDKSLATTKKKESALKEMDENVTQARGDFVKHTLQGVHELNDLLENRRLVVVDKMQAYMYSLTSYLHQGYDTLENSTPYLNSLSHALQNLDATNNTKKKLSAGLMKEVLNAASSGKTNETKLKSQDVREGYLWIQKKTGLGIGTNWNRQFCTYARGENVLTIEGFDQDGSGFPVETCVQRFQDAGERRFCFEVNSGERSIVMQAPSEAEQTAWMTAMGGLAPVKTVRKKKGRRSENKVDPQQLPAVGINEAGTKFITRLIERIESNGLDEEGIYRLSGQKTKIDRLYAAHLNGEAINVDAEDVTTLTSTLKHYFRKLPEPLLTFDLHKLFISASKEPSIELQREALKEIVTRLPQQNLALLTILMAHLKKVAEMSEQNRMDESNLGVVFGPTLMRPRIESVFGIMEIKYQNVVVEHLLRNASYIFEDGPPPDDEEEGEEEEEEDNGQKLSAVTEVDEESQDAKQTPKPDKSSGAITTQAQSPHLARNNTISPRRQVPQTPQGRRLSVSRRGRKLPSAPKSSSPSGGPPAVASFLRKKSSTKKKGEFSRQLSRTSTMAATALDKASSEAKKHGISLSQLKGLTVRALFECQGEDDTELSFKVGDIITNVCDSDEKGWLKGTSVVSKKEGLFPVNYVQYVPDLSHLQQDVTTA